MLYFIKQIDGPAGQKTKYPNEGWISFSRGCFDETKKFKKSQFLLFERKSNIYKRQIEKTDSFLESTTADGTGNIYDTKGEDSIYGWGCVNQNSKIDPSFREYNEFQYEGKEKQRIAVQVDVKHKINAKFGVPIEEIALILGERANELKNKLKCGLIKITKNEFNKLRELLISNTKLKIQLILPRAKEQIIKKAIDKIKLVSNIQEFTYTRPCDSIKGPARYDGIIVDFRHRKENRQRILGKFKAINIVHIVVEGDPHNIGESFLIDKISELVKKIRRSKLKK